MIFIDDFYGYERYTISTDALSVSAITLGATITSIKFNGRETALGYSDAAGYINGNAYVGAYVGRCANRIGNARFTLNGKEYILPANVGENQLHGGPNSYDKRRWQAEAGDDSVRFTLLSPDGDNGFPGNLVVAVTYSVFGSTLRLDFEGSCDADTAFSPTSHLYFNLDGGNVLDHTLQLNAPRYLPVREGLIPTGQVLPADGELDFSSPRRIGRNYDHCYVLSDEHGCGVSAGGIHMDMYTDFPAVQIYTGEFLDAPFGANGGLAIEPEFYPDSLSHPEFTPAILREGEKFSKYAEFVYSAEN